MSLLNAQQLADELGVHVETVYRRAAAGTIPSYHVGAAVRFDLAEVLEVLRSDDRRRLLSPRNRNGDS